MTDFQFYLASNSPRRAQILQQLGFRFALYCCEIDETPLPDEKGADYVLRMAIEKQRRTPTVATGKIFAKWTALAFPFRRHIGDFRG